MNTTPNFSRKTATASTICEDFYEKDIRWKYGLCVAAIVIAVAGIAIVESKKSNAGIMIQDKIDSRSAKDIKAESSVLAGKAASEVGEQAVNDILDKYSKAKNSDEKAVILYELSLNPNSKMPELVCTALEDPSDDVRIAAAQLLDNFNDNAIIPAISKALGDKNEEVRLLAIQALGDAGSPETAKLLAKGVSDDSEDVRNAVFSAVARMDNSTKEAVLGEAVRSKYQDVKEKVVELAVEIPSHNTVELLLGVLNDGDTGLKKEIFTVMTVFFSEEFKTCDEARRWWVKNKDRFDDDLVEK